MTAKLSKKQLKEPDIFQASFERITDYISENRARFYITVTAVILAIVIAFGIYFYWNNYQSSALEIYTKAQDNMLKNGEKPEAAQESVKVLQQLIEKYPHSWSARMAHYHLGNLYYNLGDIDNAINAYKKFVSSTRSDNAGIKFLALTSLGYCFEAKKDFKESLIHFEEAQKTNNTGFEAIGFRNIARIYEELNDKKKALENYQNALQKSTDPSMTIFIKRKIASLS